LKASLKGSPHWAGARTSQGGGLELDGSSNYLLCEDPAEAASSETLSVAVWFKAPVQDNVPDRSEVLAAKGAAWELLRTAKENVVNLSLNGPRTPEKSRFQGGYPNLSSKRKLDDGCWHHAVGTYDGKRAVLYIDGTEEEAVEASGPMALTSAPASFGDSAVSPGRLFKGALASARLYSRALTPDEVRALYDTESKP
jgi:hypothetical protein